ncbi:MAG: allophanate hydrolase subunit 1 [Actinomycetota bacterium]|nr:allophanate hydrolase subunit 1 [Actinomycetota bacterium]
MPTAARRFHEYGDAGILVELDGLDADDRWREAQHLGAWLRRAPPLGLVDVVASFASVFVSFDPLVTDFATLQSALYAAPPAGPETAPRRAFVVPIVYGGDHGPDLQQVAELLDISPADLVELHTSGGWTVRFVGSPAGAPLMDGPRLPASVPRLETPRARLQPGSVGLSGFQCVIYNAASPGGWQLIGRTPAKLFDVTTPPYVVYRPGDQLRFMSIGVDAWTDYVGRPLFEEAP